MSQPQSGILPLANSQAYFLCLNAKDLNEAQSFLQRFSGMLEETKTSFPDAHLNGVIAVGNQFWDKVFNLRPQYLDDFPTQTHDAVSAPSTPFDVLVHIRSERHDVNFEFVQRLLVAFPNTFEIADETHGFRYLDSRDLTGFVDGTENPVGEDRPAVALTRETAPFENGSYIHLQRYVHQLDQWATLSTKQQEDIIGRTKADNIEYPSADKPLTAHIKRAGIKNADGSSVEILRHSMPYGNSQERGLLFISYAHHSENFSRMLNSMIQGDDDGHTDHLMRYTRAVTGAAFFAPSCDFLEDINNYQTR